eukprot:8138025-Pyramimonas_sp.AAC.1
MDLLKHQDAIVKWRAPLVVGGCASGSVSDVAGKEYSIETTLNKMQKEWEGQQLIVMDYRETGTYVIKVDETITQMLDDHIVMTQAMGFSPFKKPFEERITEWEQ